MKIYAKTKGKNPEYYNRLPLPTQVNKLGEFLERNLSGVDKDKTRRRPNEYIIYETILYTINESVREAMKERIQELKDLYSLYPMPAEVREEIDGIERKLKEIRDTIYEMPIYLNIATYGQYIRVNVIQLDEYEITLGYMRLEPKDLVSLPYCKDKLVRYVKNVIERKYKKEGYEVLI